MSFDKEDVKHGIDEVATSLKHAVDVVAGKTSETSETLAEKAKQIGRRTGDELIAQGEKLKAASSEPTHG